MTIACGSNSFEVYDLSKERNWISINAFCIVSVLNSLGSGFCPHNLSEYCNLVGAIQTFINITVAPFSVYLSKSLVAN